jgi:hypothetical protein
MTYGLRLAAYGTALTLALGAVPVYAQESAPPPKPAAESAAPQLPTAAPGQLPAFPTQEELERIKQGLARPEFKIDDSKLRFYVEVVGRFPTWVDIAKGYDLLNGPTKRGNPMTHAEYLGLVTPRDMVSSAGIKPIESLQFALVNWAGQALIKKAIKEFSQARDERELREIRERIDKELAILTGATPVMIKK